MLIINSPFFQTLFHMPGQESSLGHVQTEYVCVMVCMYVQLGMRSVAKRNCAWIYTQLACICILCAVLGVTMYIGLRLLI